MNKHSIVDFVQLFTIAAHRRSSSSFFGILRCVHIAMHCDRELHWCAKSVRKITRGRIAKVLNHDANSRDDRVHACVLCGSLSSFIRAIVQFCVYVVCCIKAKYLRTKYS